MGFAFTECRAGRSFAGFACLSASTQGLQLLPELDTYLKANSLVRLSFQAKGDREAGEQVQFYAGPSVEIYGNHAQTVTAFDLDDSKSRFLVLEAGYNYVTAPKTPPTNRMVLAVTSNNPLGAGFLISERTGRFQLAQSVEGAARGATSGACCAMGVAGAGPLGRADSGIFGRHAHLHETSLG